MRILSSISTEAMLNQDYTQNKDEYLVKNYLDSGESVFFEVLCKRYTAPLFRYSMSFVRNKDEAEEIVQKTFIKIWKNLKTFDSEKKFSVWAYTITRRTAFDELKKRKTYAFSELTVGEGMSFEDTLEDISVSIEKSLQNLKDVNAFEEILSKMSEDKAEIVFLKLYEDMTFEEIGEMTGRPMNTVKSIYRRTLEEVRKRLVEDYQISAPKD